MVPNSVMWGQSCPKNKCSHSEASVYTSVYLGQQCRTAACKGPKVGNAQPDPAVQWLTRSTSTNLQLHHKNGRFPPHFIRW